MLVAPAIEYPQAIPIHSIDHLDDIKGPSRYVITSNSGRWWQLSMPVCALLQLMDGKTSIEKISSLARSKYRLNLPESTIRKLILEELIPKGLIIDPDKPDINLKKRRAGLFGLPIINRKWVFKIAGCLKWLYHPWIAIPVIGLAIALHMIFFFSYSRTELDQLILEHYDSIYIGLALMGLFHEFGHASASVYHNIRPGPVGFGLYYVMPVWWSDVSETWTLTRLQRMVVDLGGIYFNLLGNLILILISLFPCFKASGFEAIVVFAAWGIFFNLIPIMRLDGYWFLSDLTRIPNLNQALIRSLKELLHLQKPSIGQRLPLANRYFFYAYCILVYLVTPVAVYLAVNRLLVITINYPSLLLHFLEGFFPRGDLLLWASNWLRNLSKLVLPPMFYFAVIGPAKEWVRAWIKNRRKRKNGKNPSITQ